jgi:hypothetical protein
MRVAHISGICVHYASMTVGGILAIVLYHVLLQTKSISSSRPTALVDDGFPRALVFVLYLFANKRLLQTGLQQP